MMVMYILEDKKAVPCDDLRKWSTWFSNINNRRVALDTVGPIEVSTVFLGMDNNWGHGPPALFETMLFGACIGDLGDVQFRYATWEEAEAGHKSIVQQLTVYMYTVLLEAGTKKIEGKKGD